jgi:hypothetical protein
MSDKTKRLVLMIAAALLVLSGLAGCTSGEWLVPGGGSHIKFIKAQKGDVILDFYCNKDTSADSIAFDAVQGTASVTKWTGNGSNLAVIQQQAVMAQIQANAEAMKQIMQLVGTLTPLLAAGSGSALGALGTGGAAATADTAEQAATRAAIVAKIEACPFLAAVPAQQAAYASFVKTAPASQLPAILDMVNRLALVPVTVEKQAAGGGGKK